MCGIAGLMTTSGETPAAALLDRLAAALAHRGPDGSGRHAARNVGLVQTRLAIIDLDTGDQPLHEPGGAVLVANGEIYNYVELAAAHPDLPRATKSDCELPLLLYRRFGLDFAASLRGMYAIAIHDVPAGRLVLARDPFGIKPLYYVENARGFAFASEPSALIAAGLVEPVLAPAVAVELLQLQFTTGPDTVFAGIKRVLPGEILVVAEGRIIERRRLAALPPDGPVGLDEDAALARLDAVLDESVQIHRRSDVPYGMFLSGGIDSASLLAVMSRQDSRPVTAFTVGFDSPGTADERAQAGRVAKALGAEHVELDFGEGDFWRLLPQVAAALDDPVADYATVPTWVLGEAARRHGLKVALSGEGGDELFAGYGRYRAALRPWWAGGKAVRRRGNLDGFGILAPGTAWRDGLSATEVCAALPGRTRLQVAQAIDCADWLPHDLLLKIDRCLMAHGVEGRTPFLDREVAALAFRLPDGLKVRRRLGKLLLRKFLAGQVAAAEPFAPKQGFTVPVGRWLYKRGAVLGPLVAYAPGIAEIGAPDQVHRLFIRHEGGRAGFAAWCLLFYALWYRANILRRPPAGDVFDTLSAD